MCLYSAFSYKNELFALLNDSFNSHGFVPRAEALRYIVPVTLYSDRSIQLVEQVVFSPVWVQFFLGDT